MNTRICRITIQPKSKHDSGLYYVDRGKTISKAVITGFIEHDDSYLVMGISDEDYHQKLPPQPDTESHQKMIEELSCVLAHIPKSANPIIDYYPIGIADEVIGQYIRMEDTAFKGGD